jgi:hypothetical protein
VNLPVEIPKKSSRHCSIGDLTKKLALFVHVLSAISSHAMPVNTRECPFIAEITHFLAGNWLFW